MNLSVLCVTQLEVHALTFLGYMYEVVRDLPYPAELVVAYDHQHDRSEVSVLQALLQLPINEHANPLRVVPVTSKGYIESVLEPALGMCNGAFVLRLDDDERMNRHMERWLVEGAYMVGDHWKFERAHLWGDEQHFIPAQPLWPDHQTRLSKKAKAGGRGVIHAGSPHGGGDLADGCVIEHHCFLVRSYAERRAKMDRYNKIQEGAGWPAFNVPEIYWESDVPVAPYDRSKVPHATA